MSTRDAEFELAQQFAESACLGSSAMQQETDRLRSATRQRDLHDALIALGRTQAVLAQLHDNVNGVEAHLRASSLDLSSE